MITSLFKKSTPINFAFVFLMLLFFFLTTQFHQVGSVFSFGFLVKKTILFFVIFACFFTGNFIIKKNSLSKDSAFMVLFYLLLLLFFPTVMNNSKLFLANFFILLALRRLFSLQTSKSQKEKIFDASLWVFVASLFHFWSILFIILVFISILFHTARDYRTWFLPFIAFFISIVLLFFFDLILNVNNVGKLIASSVSSFEINYFINNYQNLALSLFATLSLFFIANLGLTISNRPIILHSTYKKIIAAFIIGLLVFVFSPNKSNDILLFTFAPLAFAMTIFVETPQSKAKTELFFLAVVGCSLFSFFSQL
jgi:hypothetical protein